MSAKISDLWVGPSFVAQALEIDPRTAKKLIIEQCQYQQIRGNRVRLGRVEADRLVSEVRSSGRVL